MATEYFNDAWRIPNNKNQSLVSNYSMEFDGTNDFVNLGSSAYLNDLQQASFSSWIKFDSVDGGPGNCFLSDMNTSTTGHFGMVVRQPGGRIRLSFYLKRSPNSLVIIDVDPDFFTTEINTWYHVVMVFDGTLSGPSADDLNRAKIYINGQSKTIFNIGSGASFYLPETLTGNTSVVNIGKMNDSGNNNATKYFDGQIDQTCIFNYALSASQVSTLYGGGTAVTNPMSLNPKPVAYYQLGDQSAYNGANYLVPNNSLQDYVFNFDGTGQVFNLDSEILLPDNKTVSFWFKLRVVPTGQFAIPLSSSNNRYYPLLQNNGGNFTVYIQGANGAIVVNTLLPIAADVWYNFIITGDGTTPLLYINGTQYTFGSGTDRTEVLIGDIGARPNGTFDLDGDMSNVAIWSGTTLSSTEVTEVYNQGSPLNLNTFSGTAPTAWWKLNAQDTFDGSNWTIKDYAGSNDGTSSGMTSANLVQSNLQHTSGYSPYALSLDGINDYLKLNNTLNNSILFGQTSFTISAWIYLSSINTPANNPVISNLGNNTARQSYMLRVTSLRNIVASVVTTTGSFTTPTVNGSFEFDKWEHITITLENQELKCYLNGRQVGSTTTNVSGSVVNSAGEGYIGARGTGVTTQVFGGNLSNIAVWQGSAQNPVTLYNNGVPGDLTSLNPSAWWQLGSNSSFDTNWTCLNEGSLTGLDAVSFNMANDDIVNGVGYSANGLGTSSIEIIGDAPYSTANGISENMDVLDRTTDVPS